MAHWVKGKAIHLGVFCLLIIYLVFSNTIFVTFFLRNGKPVPGKVQLPAQTQSFEFQLGTLEKVRYDGQDLYELHGYALHETISPLEYNIKVVLHSTSQDLIFDADPTATQPLLVKRSDYHRGMDHAEFRMLFSDNVLRVDNYQIGILIEENQGPGQYFQLTGKYIERTPNNIRYLAGP